MLKVETAMNMKYIVTDLISYIRVQLNQILRPPPDYTESGTLYFSLSQSISCLSADVKISSWVYIGWDWAIGHQIATSSGHEMIYRSELAFSIRSVGA